MADPEMEVSVIIASYNRATVLPRAVASVQAQTFCDWHLIIVDDGSQDATPAWLATLDDGRIDVHICPVNRGVSAARNLGIRQARGQWLAFLDSDDWWPREYLEQQLAYARAQTPQCGLVIAGLERVHRDGRRYLFPTPALRVPPQRYLAAIEQNAVTFTQTWLLRKEVLDRAGVFDESMSVWEDWDLLLRVAALTEVHQRAVPVVGCAESSGGLSDGAPARRLAALRRMREKYGIVCRERKPFLARLASLEARYCIQLGQWACARGSAGVGIRLQPFSPKLWALCLWAVVGSTGVLGSRGQQDVQ